MLDTYLENVAIMDALAGESLSTILEFAALVGVVLGFFRWYDSKYRVLVRDTKQQIMDKIDATAKTTCEKIEELKNNQSSLRTSYYNHVERHNEREEKKQDDRRRDRDRERERDYRDIERWQNR